MSGPIPYGAPADITPLSIAGGTAELGDIFGAAVDQMQLVDNSNAAQNALEEAYANRTRAVKAATGADLGNPLVPMWTAADATAYDQQAAAPGLPDMDAPVAARDAIIARQRAAYADKLSELAKQFPQFAATIKADVPVDQDAQQLAAAADEKLGTLMASNPSWQAQIAGFAGGAAGSFNDPIVLGSMFLGGGPGAARSTLGRILETAAKEALINAGTTAAQQPFVQAWRKEAGLPNGFDQAAQNVLMAAAVGGIFGAGAGAVHAAAGAVADVLGKARAALPADARGAIDAAAQDAATVAQAPAGVAPERFDAAVSRADAAAQRVDVPEPVTPPNIEAEVAQITDSLAPHPDSVTGPEFDSVRAANERLATLVAKTGEGSQRVPKPISDYVRQLGGVDPSSPLAEELRAAGVTQPSLFKKGGLTALDNLPHAELPAEARFAVPEDGNGYASQQGLIDAMALEDAGRSGPGQPLPGGIDAERAALEARGVDFARPPEEIKAKLAELAQVDRRYRAAQSVDGLSTDEVTHVPEGVSRRDHTEQLVRRVLELQPGLPAERVRDAVNLSLFENTPIDQAVSDVLSDAAGVPRGAPAADVETALQKTFPDLGAPTPFQMPGGKAFTARDAERFYTSVGSAQINKWARDGRFPAKLQFADREMAAATIRKLVSEAKPLEKDLSVFRGRHSGDSQTGFRSYTTDRAIAEAHANKVAPHGVVDEVTLPKGTPVIEVREGGEREIIAVPKSIADVSGRPATDALALPSELPSRPPELGEELAAAEAPKVDLEAERAAFEALGFGGDFKLPIGDELVSLNELEARLEESRREIRVVEACRE